MKLTDLFIRRPVLAIVVNLLIIIAGLQAMRSLNGAAQDVAVQGRIFGHTDHFVGVTEGVVHRRDADRQGGRVAARAVGHRVGGNGNAAVVVGGRNEAVAAVTVDLQAADTGDCCRLPGRKDRRVTGDREGGDADRTVHTRCAAQDVAVQGRIFGHTDHFVGVAEGVIHRRDRNRLPLKGVVFEPNNFKVLKV